MDETVASLVSLIKQLASKIKSQKEIIENLKAQVLSEEQKAEIDTLLRETKDILTEEN